MLFEPIYSLPAAADIKASGATTPGYSGGMYFLPHGSPYTDEFRKDRAPTPRELIRQLTGVAYACATSTPTPSLRPGCGCLSAPPPMSRPRDGQPARSRSSGTPIGPAAGAAGFATEQSQIEEITDHPLLRLLDVQHAGVGVDPEAFEEDCPMTTASRTSAATTWFT